MASEEIKLIGSFKDDITPQLKKLNRQIETIGRSFGKFSRNLRPIAKEFGRMAMASRSFNDELRQQAKLMNGSSRAMREYKSQAGKMVGAMRAVEQQRQKSMRAQGMTRSQQKRGGGGGGGGVSPVPAAGGGGGGRGKAGGAAVGAAAGQSFMKNIASTAIGMGIANAFASGVHKLKSVITAPFTKFGSMFAERMNDEMDDIKSAGGLFALDMDLTAESGNTKLFNNFNEALRFQEEINTRMAASASNLPGTTSEFVNMNRRMTDTIQMVMENNRENFIKFGERQGADVSMGGTDAAKEAMAQVGQNLTESLMLASAGQQGGLPMDLAIQQLMNMGQGKIKMQAFTNKFRAAFQKNPLLKNFLMRAEEEMNKTAAGSSERLELISDVFSRAIPEDQINKMRGSLNGLVESVRSGLLDPQGGLFGLSRAVSEFDKDGNVIGKLMKRNVNDMGEVLYKMTDVSGIIDPSTGKQMVKGAELTEAQIKKLGYTLTETGQVLNKAGKEIGKTSESTTYLFEQLRDIGANYGIVLTQIVGLLPSIFDPFAKMTSQLVPMREQSVAFFNTFRNFNKNLQGHVDFLKKSSDAAVKGNANRLSKQIMTRSALATIADFLAATGAMQADQATNIVKSMLGKDSMTADAVNNFDQTAAKAFKDMFDSLMGSDLMERLGEIGGTVIGGITRLMLDMISGVSSMAKGQGGNRLMDGFIKGFKEAFDGMSFNDAKGIITGVITDILSKALDVLFTLVLPNLLDMYIGGLFAGLQSDSLISKIFAGIGLYKLGAMIFTAVSGIISAVTALASPMVLVVAGFIGLALIFRNLDYILSSVVESFKIFWNSLSWVGASMLKLVLDLVSKIPGAKFLLGDAVKGLEGALAGFEKNIDESGKKIQQNTTDSLNRTKSEFMSLLGSSGLDNTTKMLTGLSESAGEATAAIEKHAQAYTLQNQEGGKSTYEVGGMRFDAATGLPVDSITAGATYEGGGLTEELTKPVQKMDEQASEVAKIGEAAKNAAPNLENTAKAAETAAGAFEAMPPKVEAALLGAATSAGNAITTAAQGLAKALSNAATSIKSAATAKASVGGDTAKGAYGGSGNMTKSMPLADAIATEKKNMPTGAGLVIANTSETIIPAFAGHAGDGFKGLSFAELESAAGFDRMASYTDQIAEIADKTAASFSGGFGGALGGGSATLNAMEALGHSFGLITTSGHRPGDPGFHGVNRARDLSNGGGETPEMNAAAAKMASEFGSSLTELIYTPMGFSIKNGQKTGLISPANHYHHIHVAVAEGLQKAAVFSSQKAAENYERSMMPVGAEPMKVNLASMTANSSEFSGGGGVTVGDIHVNVSGVDNPKQIANVVAEEILDAIQRSSYDELFTN